MTVTSPLTSPSNSLAETQLGSAINSPSTSRHGALPAPKPQPNPLPWSNDQLVPFGKYILLNKVSSGATAAVYCATLREDSGLERMVTVKRVLPQMAGDPEFVETFVREAKTCARLVHSSICPIYELGKIGESLYMVSQWVAGRDLGALVKRLQETGRVMPPITAAFIANRLCDALDYAHSLKNEHGVCLGIIHRDISPANILVSFEGEVKLMDFGIALASGRSQQTNVDALKRKLSYMSPELVRGTALDARSDVFGVGVCLYEMVTGQRLFAAPTDIATLKLVSEAAVPADAAALQAAPQELASIILRALAREPEERWPSAGEMAHALSTYAAQSEPGYGTKDLAELMREWFAPDMEADQRALHELLTASQDLRLMEHRRRFFASPHGAAAAAKAEAARKLNAKRPITGDYLKPQASEGANATTTAQPLSAPAATSGPALDYEDEEPTAAFTAKHLRRNTPLDTTTHPPGDDEPTSAFVPTHLSAQDAAASTLPGPAAVVPGGEQPLDVEAEATQVFFSKQHGQSLLLPQVPLETSFIDLPEPLRVPPPVEEFAALTGTGTGQHRISKLRERPMPAAVPTESSGTGDRPHRPTPPPPPRHRLTPPPPAASGPASSSKAAADQEELPELELILEEEDSAPQPPVQTPESHTKYLGWIATVAILLATVLAILVAQDVGNPALAPSQPTRSNSQPRPPTR